MPQSTRMCSIEWKASQATAHFQGVVGMQVVMPSGIDSTNKKWKVKYIVVLRPP